METELIAGLGYCVIPVGVKLPQDVNQTVHIHHPHKYRPCYHLIVQELCESRGGRPGLSILTSLLVSVDVKIY